MEKIIGNKLRNIRKERGFSQEQVADYLSISQSAYARIENGQSQSWSIHLEKLCVLHKINIESLFLKNAFSSDSDANIYNHNFQINQSLIKLIEQYKTQINHLKDIIYHLQNK